MVRCNKGKTDFFKHIRDMKATEAQGPIDLTDEESDSNDVVEVVYA